MYKRQETFVAGAKVERLFPFGPLPGCAVMATMITHNATACLGLNCDAASISDPELFAECIVAGFDEVLAVAEPTGDVTDRVGMRRVV